MDFVNKMTGGGNSQSQGQTSNEQLQSTGSSGEQQQSSGGFLGGIGDKLNSAAGGGRESEKNEDYLDKGELKLSHAMTIQVLTRRRCRLRAGEVPWTGTSGQRGMWSFQPGKRMSANTVQSAVEQAKDEQISDFIRGQYKGATGSDIPIKDKETRFG
jgi:hypothetical protein